MATQSSAIQKMDASRFKHKDLSSRVMQKKCSVVCLKKKTETYTVDIKATEEKAESKSGRNAYEEVSPAQEWVIQEKAKI